MLGMFYLHKPVRFVVTLRASWDVRVVERYSLDPNLFQGQNFRFTVISRVLCEYS